jgi:hypothetical protein
MLTLFDLAFGFAGAAFGLAAFLGLVVFAFLVVFGFALVELGAFEVVLRFFTVDDFFDFSGGT